MRTPPARPLGRLSRALEPPRPAGARRRAVAAVATIVLASLVPGVVHTGTLAALLALPAEAIVVLLLLRTLDSPAARAAVAALFAVTVVAATALAALDRAFLITVDRGFRAAEDTPQLLAAAGVVEDSVGAVGLTALVAAVVAVVAAAIAGLTLAALAASNGATRAESSGRMVAAGAAAIWIVGAVLGAQLVPGVPFAAADAARSIAGAVEQSNQSVRDREAFERALTADPFADRAVLLDALEGTDVVFAFVESYGRVALEGPGFSDGVRSLLREEAARLDREGYEARSGFLTSPTFGGESWLAHATLQSGVWVEGQRAHDRLMASDRLTLSRAFGAAGWRTVAVVPSNTDPWPDGRAFYRFDDVLDARSLDYDGPAFGYALVPDQFTWRQFHDRVLGGAAGPVMAEIDLVSSHTPWTPLPRLVPWARLGDVEVFRAQVDDGEHPLVAWQDSARVRELYGESIEYSLGATLGYLDEYHPRHLVLVIVGDHQPARVVSGPDADHDVPVTIITDDTDVLARIDAWDWEPGLIPSPEAPVWRMDDFRDRFLEAFTDG